MRTQTRSIRLNDKTVQPGSGIKIVLLGFLSLMLSAVIFVLVLQLFPLLTSSLPATVGTGKHLKQINWNLLGDIASLTTLSLFIGGVVFAFIKQYQTDMQRAQESAEASLNVYKELYDRLMNPKAIESRRWVILNLPTIEDLGNDKEAWLKELNTRINKVPRGWKGQRPPGKEHVKEILNTLDFIGFASRYWKMEDDIVTWMSPSVAKVWERIDLYVEEEAIQRNEPDYYESARNFGKYCVAWRRKHYPKSKVIKNAT